MPKKKILIIHATAGSGHTKSAEAIYKAFGEQANDFEVKLINSLEYMTAFFSYSYPRVYVFLVNRIPLVWGFFYYVLDNKVIYGTVSWIRHIFNWLHSRRLANFLAEYKPDVIINTHFLAPDVISMMPKSKINAHVITVVTDYKMHSFWIAKRTNTYVVTYKETKEDLVKWGVNPNNVEVLGMPIDPVFFKELDKDKIRKALSLKDNLLTVLVGSGGFGIGPVERLVNELIGIDMPMQLIVVCGKNESLYNAVKDLANKANFPIITLGFVHNMHELMEVSDLIVSKSGGIVCAEALSKDLPIIALSPIPGQESRNLEMLLKKGFAQKLGKIEGIKTVLKEFYSNRENLESIKKKIEKAKKPSAAASIAKLAANIVK